MLGFAVLWCIALPMFALDGLKPGELRERLISYALRTYTWQGDVIPGLRRGRFATFVLWELRYDGADAPRAGSRREGERIKYAAEHAESESLRHTMTDRYVPS